MAPEDVDKKMTGLARTFPCLRGASGVAVGADGAQPQGPRPRT